MIPSHRYRYTSTVDIDNNNNSIDVRNRRMFFAHGPDVLRKNWGSLPSSELIGHDSAANGIWLGRPESGKATSLPPGRGTLTNKWASTKVSSPFASNVVFCCQTNAVEIRHIWRDNAIYHEQNYHNDFNFGVLWRLW